jgi:hypothetical protein
MEHQLPKLGVQGSGSVGGSSIPTVEEAVDLIEELRAGPMDHDERSRLADELIRFARREIPFPPPVVDFDGEYRVETPHGLLRIEVTKKDTCVSVCRKVDGQYRQPRALILGGNALIFNAKS